MNRTRNYPPRRTDFFLRASLCWFLPGACPAQPAAPQPLPPSPLATQVELDKIFYSNPQRLGNAAQAHELMQPPEARMISLNLVEGEYQVEVVAAPGAVPANARVVIANMETLAFRLVSADDQGGF